jgi:hypothetical protein
VWDEKIREIESVRPYIKSLLEEADAEATTSDKVANLVVLGLIAIPLVGVAAVTIPEMIVAFEAASMATTWAIPGAASAFAFAVEHYVVSEIVAYFVVGTITSIVNAGGIPEFVDQLQTPEGRFQTGCDIVFFIVQIKSARPGGGGYVRVRAKVVNRSPESIQLRVEHVEEVHPAPVAPPKLGKLYLQDPRAKPRPSALTRGRDIQMDRMIEEASKAVDRKPAPQGQAPKLPTPFRPIAPSGPAGLAAMDNEATQNLRTIPPSRGRAFVYNPVNDQIAAGDTIHQVLAEKVDYGATGSAGFIKRSPGGVLTVTPSDSAYNSGGPEVIARAKAKLRKLGFTVQ